MEIVKENLNFSSFHLSASENLLTKERFIQNGDLTGHQKISKYNLNLKLDYTTLNFSQIQFKDERYNPSKVLKWATFSSRLANQVADQIDELYKDDPEIAKKYLILMEFLQDTNPDAAERLAKRMDHALKFKNKHGKIANHIEDQIKKIVDKFQYAQRSELKSIAERVHIKIDLKLEIIQREKSIEKTNKDISVSSITKSIRLRMTIDIGVEHTEYRADPLIIDLDGDGFDMRETDKGVMFDINGDGKKELTSWITGDDAFLALDRNLNGIIDSGKELFGDQNGALNGFLELAKLDQDKNGIIDFKDPMFSKLLLFKDINQNGKSEKGELIPIYKAGITSINLNYLKLKTTYSSSILKALSTYEKDNGKRGIIGDFDLFYQTLP